METKTFRQWMNELGYKWTSEEQLVKGTMTAHQASVMISQYQAKGLITNG